ncbi:DUF7507 domain-containing protein [Limimaricola litoreus]|uniref:GEVED domain-containing protein n=1 Tax=Limimaricola litoreus TaxID=2955316 RepID=A0A9X2FTA3_9RHOB|nr:GEVED domain-containing protein [Limimaricola litoreus]MCP1170315.1 GEVED domain-containing protein [Limimaricola litoreus]
MTPVFRRAARLKPCRRLVAASLALGMTLAAAPAPAQELVLQTVGAPQVVGSGAGKRALWRNAGRVDGRAVDIVGVLTDAALDHVFGTGNGQIQITSAAQDVHFADFHLYEAGTHDLVTDQGGVPVIADVNIQINDIDGPSNEQVYAQICGGGVEYVRVDRTATTRRGFFTGASAFGSEIFILEGDRNYNNEPVSGLEIFYPQTSVFRFGRTANTNFLVRLANPSYELADTFNLQCGDFRATTLVDDIKEQVLGEPVRLSILYNDSVATGNNNPPANNSQTPSRYALQAVDLVPPATALNEVTDDAGHRIGFDVPGEGTWSYDDASGELTFTPLVAFFGAPTPIEYRLQRPENTAGPVFTAPATVTIDVGSVGLLKMATLADVNLNGYADPGETIAYVFTAENFGNLTLTDVALAETRFSGKGVPPVITFQSATGLSPEGTLEPGEKAVYTATYTLVPEDLDTTISNQAEVTARTASGTPVSDLSDSENESDGDGVARNGGGAGRDDPTSIYAGSGPDRGDAPATYGDPQHDDTSQYRIGAEPGDGDGSTQHSADAKGDDTGRRDDEEEALFPQLYGGLTRRVSIPVGEPVAGSGLLQVFVDFAADGSFLTPGDKVGTDLRDGGANDLDGQANGAITFDIAVPPTAPLVPSFARLRFSSVAGLDATAAAPDGEVEDHAITLRTPPEADRGDAPASYGDPRHVVEGAPDYYLGTVPPDADAVSQAGAGAQGDDLSGQDDEDGVSLGTLHAGGLAQITVTVNEPTPGSAWLQGFIDFDGDGSFAQAGDRVAHDLQDGGPDDRDGAVDGTITFEVAVPAGATAQTTYARFRWSTDSLGSETAFDGEVEDYALTISDDPPPFLCDGSLYRFDDSSTVLRRLRFTSSSAGYTVNAQQIGAAGAARTGPWGYNAVDGYLYGLRPGDTRLYRVDGSGSFTDMGKISGAEDAARAGDILPDGTMIYAVDATTWQIVDLATPSSPVSRGLLNLAFGVAPEDIAWNPADGHLYGIDQSTGRLFRAPANGGLPGTITPQLIGPAIYAGVFGAIWFDGAGRLYGYSDTTHGLFLIDTATGGAQLIARMSFDEGGLSEGASCRGAAPIRFGAIAGHVYEDANASDTRDAGETDLGAGIGLRLFNESGTPSDTSDDVEIKATETAADGSYGFSGLLVNTGHRVLLDEADPDLGAGRRIGTSNPRMGVAVAPDRVTRDQDFGFDAAGSDLSITSYIAAHGTTTPRSSAAPGDLLDWIVTVENAGAGSPSGVKVIARIPDGYDYVSDSAPATGDSYDPETGLWFVDEIIGATSERLTVTLRMRETGETTGRAEIIYSSLPDPDSDPGVGASVDDGNDGLIDDDETAYALARIDSGRRLEGRVFLDDGSGGATAHDARRGGDETGLGGVALRLTGEDGTQLARLTTDAAGRWSYSLAADHAGAVMIEVLPGEGRIAISERSDALPGLVDADPHDGRFAYLPATATDYLDLDFGLLPVPQLSEDQVAAISAGQVVTLAHRYTASSSGRVGFAVTILSETPRDGYAVALFDDPACDGAPDQPLLADVAVTAGMPVCLVLRVSAGAGVGPGGSLALRLDATTTFTDTTATHGTANIDRLGSTTTASGLILRKTVRNITQGTPEGTANQGAPGDLLTYRIDVLNAAGEPVQDLAIFDRTPPYTALSAPPTDPTALAPGVSCDLVTPATAASGYEGHLGWSCSGALQPGAQGSVSFTVRIRP